MVIVTIPVISILLTTLVPQIHTLTEILSIPFQLRLFIGITNSPVNDLFNYASFN